MNQRRASGDFGKGPAREGGLWRKGLAPAALAGGILLALAAPGWGAEAKDIPVRIIPPKRIPNEAQYRQAPAFDPRQRKNRRVVHEARQEEERELKRTGTAYEMESR